MNDRRAPPGAGRLEAGETPKQRKSIVLDFPQAYGTTAHWPVCRLDGHKFPPAAELTTRCHDCGQWIEPMVTLRAARRVKP